MKLRAIAAIIALAFPFGAESEATAQTLPNPEVPDPCFSFRTSFPPKDAIEACNRLFNQARLPPQYSRSGVLTARGIAYHRAGDLEHAKADYDAAIQLDPSNPNPYYNRAQWYAQKGNLNLAIEDLNFVVRSQPRWINGFLVRGNVLARSGNFQAAIDDFSEAIRLDPNRADAYRARAAAYRMAGRQDLADADFATAQRIAPMVTIVRKPDTGNTPASRPPPP